MLPEAHQAQAHFVTVLHNWLVHQPKAPFSQSQYERNTEIWSNVQIVEELKRLGVVRSTVTNWDIQLDSIMNEGSKNSSMNRNAKKKDKQDVPENTILSSGSCRVLKGLYLAMLSLMDTDSQHLDAYRMVLIEEIKNGPKGIRTPEVTFGFWCLSPEVVFGPLAQIAKSIILTSGTLAPMDTFASELKVSFPVRLEAMHIIEKSQVFASVLPTSRSGLSFTGIYKNMESFEFQDELARAIFDICCIVPFGVVCFLSSYSFMDKLIKRMQSTGMYEQISAIKGIMREPQGTSKENDKFLAKYYDAIAASRQMIGNGGVNGVLMFAVYRGKVSEGLDLTDDNARAVIPVGIPFGAITDEKIAQKKNFNDKHRLSKGLMSGNDW